MATAPQFWLHRTAFARLSVVLGVLWLLVWGYAAWTIVQHGGASKQVGWTATPDDGAWVVRAVAPGGAAEHLLQPGDRLLAIDGDSAVQLIGPAWILRDSPEKHNYRLTIARDDRVREMELDWPVRVEPGLATWLWIHLVTGLAFCYVGLLIAVGKPESLAARRAALSSMLSSGFFVTLTLHPNGGLVGGWLLPLAVIAFAIRPFHLLAGYRFNASFPLEQHSVGRWRRFELIAYAVCLVIWIPSAYAAVLRALGPERAVPIAVAQYPFSLLHDAFVDMGVIAVAAVLAVANVLVILRNYRAVSDPDLKRRLRWVSVGIGANMVPILLVAPVLLAGYAIGARLQLQTLVRVVNTLTIVAPIAIGYAVLRHRVLGLRVILRTGIRYLMARHVLRAALVMPLLFLVYTVVSNPSATVSDLLVGDAARLNLGVLGLAGLALAFRRPLLRGIDRRFFREAYNQDQIFLALADAIGRAADVTELSRLLSSQIQSAIHPRAVCAVSVDDGDEFSTLFSSSGEGDARTLASFHLTPSEFAYVQQATEVKALPHLSTTARSCMETLRIELVVPIRGPNEGVVGLLLLGDKLSEEPYTRRDRQLLDTTATQTGVVWENLRLRARLRREEGVRRNVLTQFEGSSSLMLMECEQCGACYDASVTHCITDGRALSPTLPVSRVLDGKYRLDRVIGRGGMGAVYRAMDLRLDRVVAVKITTGSMFGDAITLQRFAREARASAKLDHPNVVRAFDVGEVPGGAYLVLELLRGTTLRRRLQECGRLTPEEAGRILAGVFEGITAAHARGIVHRDLKPENIFLAEVEGDAPALPKILDFGLAVVHDAGMQDRHRLTQTGAAVGTLAYMSAEQFLGERVDERADIYALGVVALEMVTGDLKAKGPTFGRIAGLIDQRLRTPANSPQQHAVARVLLRAVSEAREQRYASVVEFREALLPALDRCVVLPGTAGLASNMATAPPPAATR